MKEKDIKFRKVKILCSLTGFEKRNERKLKKIIISFFSKLLFRMWEDKEEKENRKIKKIKTFNFFIKVSKLYNFSLYMIYFSKIYLNISFPFSVIQEH